MRFLRLKDVMTMTGLSRSSIYRYIAQEQFPVAVSLGGRSIAWVESEVQSWMQHMLDARDSQVLYGY